MYPVDMIIKGRVLDLGSGEKRDTGLVNKMGSITYDVTPATIEVEETLFSKEQLTSKTITFLQHGLISDESARKHFVNKSDEVYLILVKTKDGKYWSYNYDDGVWFIKDGAVYSNSKRDLYQKYQNAAEESFKESIKKAALESRPQAGVDYGE